MASLKETKDHIGSVKSTLKITSAMKLVASAKLRKAQRAIETLRPYEETLSDILASLRSSGASTDFLAAKAEDEVAPASNTKKKIAVVAISSNSSLCGGFNANVIKKAKALMDEKAAEGNEVTVFALGRKMSEAIRKTAYNLNDCSNLVGHLVYKDVTALAQSIAGDFMKGEYSEVWLVYTHFITTSHQEVRAERYLPFDESALNFDAKAGAEVDFIVEPSPSEVLESLMPQVLMLKFYAATLDSEASEHGARTIAMQTASDNAEDLLAELTLEYNKGRQQKITAEILDLVGGMAAES